MQNTQERPSSACAHLLGCYACPSPHARCPVTTFPGVLHDKQPEKITRLKVVAVGSDVVGKSSLHYKGHMTGSQMLPVLVEMSSLLGVGSQSY